MPTLKVQLTSVSNQKSYAEVMAADNDIQENVLKNQTGRIFNIFVEYDHGVHFAYVKLYDSVGSVVHGTSHPIFVYPLKNITTFGMSIMSQSGILFNNGACIGAASVGGTGPASAPPAGNVDVYISGS
tara:strand:+ start:2482 stop:2865 length:384 start_codon:yes stop_codon:yes gene_type:complete